MMKNFEYYRSLPEGMAAEAVERELEEFLQIQADMNVFQFMEALDELADRQWHTYSLLSESLKFRLEDLVISRWQDQPEVTNYALSIVSRLGLVRAWCFLVALDRKVISAASREAIQDAETEMSSTISDPYSGMVKNR